MPDETMEAESDPDEEEKIEEEEIVPERVIGVCRVWKEFYSEASGSNGQGSKARWYEGIVARLERVRGELLYLVVYHDGDQEHVNVERLRDMRRVEPDPKRVGAGWKVDWSKRYE